VEQETESASTAGAVGNAEPPIEVLQAGAAGLHIVFLSTNWCHMNVGQRVLLIGPVDAWAVAPKPPIGSVGEITEPMDSDGDYFILFPEYPCPVGEPEWCVHRSMLVPLDDGEPVKPQAETLTV